MEENNFNAGNNYVHSEPASVKSGSGLSKVLAICFAITTDRKSTRLNSSH